MKLLSAIRNTRSGFTLIELLLYVVLSGIILSAVAYLSIMLLESRIRNQAVSEVEQQGLYAVEIIADAIRNSEGVNSPAQGGTATSLSLNVFNAANDPTIFDVATGTLRMTEGATAAVPLTSGRVIASGLRIDNLSKTATPGTIRVEFTLNHLNAVGRPEYEYGRTFSAAASRR